MKFTDSILVGADIAPPREFDFWLPPGSNVAYPADHPIVTAMAKDEQYTYRDRSRHYLSYDDVLRINDKSGIRLTWNAVDRHWTVRAWTDDLDEIGGNLKGVIHDVQLIRHFNPAIKGVRREAGETHDLWEGYLREFGRP
jgi:hypothetical protein